MRKENALYGIALQKLLALSAMINSSDNEHYIDFSIEDFILYEGSNKIVAIDTGSGYLSVIVSYFNNALRKAIPFNEIGEYNQKMIISILDKYLLENSAN